MDNRLLSFLKSLDDISFETPTDSDIEKLQKLSSGRLPAMFIAAYSKSVPADNAEYCDFVFYGIDRIVDENTDYVPGANLLPLGLFTFSSTLGGDSICFDMNDSYFPVYLCSHSLLSGEDDISYYKDEELHTFPFNYENVLKFADKLADSFDEFVIKLQSGEFAETVEHTLKTDRFTLTLSPWESEAELKYSDGITMDIKVENKVTSKNFFADTTMYLDIKDLAEFAVDLCQLYEKLSGEARIEALYKPNGYLSFTCTKRGYIAIKGYLHTANDAGNEQTFEFQHVTDQSYLKEFCYDLKAAYSRYLK